MTKKHWIEEIFDYDGSKKLIQLIEDREMARTDFEAARLRLAQYDAEIEETALKLFSPQQMAEARANAGRTN